MKRQMHFTTQYQGKAVDVSVRPDLNAAFTVVFIGMTYGNMYVSASVIVTDVINKEDDPVLLEVIQNTCSGFKRGKVKLG